MRTIFLLAMLIAAPALADGPPRAAGPTLGDIRIQLYYKITGTLSANVAPPAHPDFWNTGAGEGDAKEPAEDIVVSVPIRMPPGSDMGENSEVPLTLTVRNAAGKLLGARTFDFISIPYAQPVWSPLWISGIQCAGKITATAIWGKQRKSTSVTFSCGE